jgi:hypothetical protein
MLLFLWIEILRNSYRNPTIQRKPQICIKADHHSCPPTFQPSVPTLTEPSDIHSLTPAQGPRVSNGQCVREASSTLKIIARFPPQAMGEDQGNACHRRHGGEADCISDLH